MKNLLAVLLIMLVSRAAAQNDVWSAQEDFGGDTRFLGTSFSIGTKIYAGTGLSNTTFSPVDDFWEFDVSNNHWTQKGSFDGGARFGTVSFSINGKGYVAMGVDFVTGTYADVWEYTASNDTWLKKADFPGVGRAGAFVFVVNNKAYVGAGQGPTGDPLNDLWEYDPSTDSWVQKASLPSTPRLYAAAFSIDTKGYVGSGLDQEDGGLADFWEYNTANDQWTRKADLPQANAGAIGFATPTRGYMGAGSGVKLYSYYPNENVWVEEAPYPVGFNYVNASCAMVGGKAYVGLGGASPSSKYYRYTPGNDQSITFNALASKTFGDAPFALTATSSSGLGVTYTSSNLSVATIVGSTVTIVGGGTTTIKASQAGNVVYDAALPVERVLTVAKANQAITFNTLPGKSMGDGPFDLAGTASSSLSLSYVSSNTSVATINGATVTIVGAGTTTITASQAGNENYNAATSVDRDLVVSKLSQTITFGALPAKTVTSPPFNLVATASSGLAVSYISSNTSVATVTGSTVTIVGGGATTITASQAGNAAYNAAASIDRDLVVTKVPQTWIGTLPTAAAFSTGFNLTLQLSSGIPYTLTSSNPNIATVAFNGSDWVVTPIGLGTTTLTASHPGNASLEPAATITADLVISKGTQTITFVDFNAYGGYSVTTATASSGLPVTFDEPADNSTVITGNIATVFGSFNGTLTARQAGNEFYEAVEADWTLVIGKLDAPLTMESIPEMAVGDPAFTPTVTTISTLVTYTLSSTNPAVAIIVSGQVNIIGKGTANIFATNPGNDYYKPSATFRELVVKDPHVLSFAELPVKTFGDAPFTVEASSSEGVPVTFSSSDPGIATVSGDTVTITGVGSAWIIASAGDATHARRNVSRVLTVKNVTQMPVQQGQFWGVAMVGGTARSGAIYKTNSDGSGVTIVKELKGGADGGTRPNSSVVVASNGKIYGTTYTGGGPLNGGSLFEYDPATAAFTKKYDLGYADYPIKNLVATANGKIYGAKTASVNHVYGTIVFEFDVATGTFTKEKTVSGVISWVSDVIVASSGKVYVTGSAGNQLELRTFAEWDLAANTLTKKAEVPWYSGSTAPTNFAELDGKFYGTTQVGGANNEGFVYEFDPVAGTATEKASFTKANFNFTYPQGLMKASNGKLYGCASWGGLNKNGYVFLFDPLANTITNVADFPAFTGVPTGRMMEAPNGKLYGTDNSGNMGGSIFQFNPANNELLPQIILNDNIGKAVPGNLGLLGNKFFGFGSRGGANNAGTVFEFDYAARKATKTYDFSSATEGYSPMIGLAATSNGKLYGINKYGGAYDDGTIFEYDLASDVYKKVFDFNGNTVGSNPWVPLTAGLNGKLYGSTRSGTKNTNSSGTLFEFDPNTGTYQTLVTLSHPMGLSLNHKLVQASDGKFYGLMLGGGTNSLGVLFELDPVTKKYRKLQDFFNANGASPNTAPMIASNGKIYGTTPLGGADNKGVLFEYDLGTSTYTVKHNFATATGEKPYTILTEVNGKLWGTTVLGGNANKGVIFQYDPSTGDYTKKYDFDTNGRNPGGNMLSASNGKLYVQTTGGGGQFGDSGLIVEYDIETNTIVKRSDLPSGVTQFDYTINTLVQATKSFKDEQTITITPVSAKVLGEAPFTPTATASSGMPVEFSAGNAKITVASDSKVTLVQAGKAILKATQAGDASTNPAEAQVEFCVNPGKPGVMPTANSSGTLTLASSNAEGNQWYKDGAAISGAVNKTLEVSTPGAYTVKTVIEECASEVSASFAVVVTGDDETSLSSVLVYPNPTEDKLYIALPGSSRKSVMLLQTDGRIMEQHETSATLMELDVRSYSAGLYFVQVSNEKGHQTLKFIKK
jgi:uncharacterized repeat protein (TIGR03803 family)